MKCGFHDPDSFFFFFFGFGRGVGLAYLQQIISRQFIFFDFGTSSNCLQIRLFFHLRKFEVCSGHGEVWLLLSTRTWRHGLFVFCQTLLAYEWREKKLINKVTLNTCVLVTSLHLSLSHFVLLCGDDVTEAALKSACCDLIKHLKQETTGVPVSVCSPSSCSVMCSGC